MQRLELLGMERSARVDVLRQRPGMAVHASTRTVFADADTHAVIDETALVDVIGDVGSLRPVPARIGVDRKTVRD